MYDVLVKSTVFGVRNADKVINTNDKGRIFADVGQFTNAAKAASQLDNALGKGAQAAINTVGKYTKESKALNQLAKGAQWASKNVNPLLVGAAGYRVLTAEDKTNALKREIWGMSSMFAVENMIKTFFSSASYQNFKNNAITNPKLKSLVLALEGILFVGGSIAASTTGYKIGKALHPDKIEDKSTNLSYEEIKNMTSDINLVKDTLKSKNVNKTPEYFTFRNGQTIA